MSARDRLHSGKRKREARRILHRDGIESVTAPVSKSQHYRDPKHAAGGPQSHALKLLP